MIDDFNDSGIDNLDCEEVYCSQSRDEEGILLGMGDSNSGKRRKFTLDGCLLALLEAILSGAIAMIMAALN